MGKWGKHGGVRRGWQFLNVGVDPLRRQRKWPNGEFEPCDLLDPPGRGYVLADDMDAADTGFRSGLFKAGWHYTEYRRSKTAGSSTKP